MVALTKGELLCPWEDDDISFPWRISMSIKKLGDGHYWKPIEYWYWDGGYHYNHTFGVSHNQCIMTRELFDEIKGYRHTSGNQDQLIERDIKNSNFNIVAESLREEDWFYLYRWNTGSYHGSGTQKAYDAIGTIEIKTGEYEINPHWEKEYPAETQRLIKLARMANQLPPRSAKWHAH